MKYNIGDICFSWEGETYPLIEGKFFKKFKTNDFGDLSIKFKIEFVALKEYTNDKCIEANGIYELYYINDERFLIYHWRFSRWAFGFYPDRIDYRKENICYFDESMKKEWPLTDDWFFGLIGLHKALLQKEKPIVHGSYIDYNGEAIIFTAPSQTGKSTQADLWSKYAGAEIINGDRVLFGKKDGRWHAYGYPSCGSSDICVNRTLPIRAIVILEQSCENVVRPVSLTDGVRGLMAAIEVYKWDLAELDMSLKLAQEIAGDVDVVKLSCRPDEEAVEVLKNYLKEN